MYRNSYYDKIMNLVKERPRSQKEIKDILGRNKITILGISKHLKEGIKRKEVAYFGNTFGRLYPKMLLRKKYQRKWPENAQKFYFYTPKSAELYKKLIKKYKKGNLDLITEITRLYQAIEVKAKFQEIYFSKEINQRDVRRYYRMRKRIVKFDSNNKEFLKFIKTIKMDPLMHWCAYMGGLNMKDITIPMFEKMRELFVRINKQ